MQKKKKKKPDKRKPNLEEIKNPEALDSILGGTTSAGFFIARRSC